MEYDYWRATKDAAGSRNVLVLMHGRGADRSDLGGLQGRLPTDWHVVLPDAPHGGAAWGYGPGRAWYRYLGEDRPDLESLGVSLSSLDSLIADLPSLVGGAPGNVVVGGFSQGGTMGHAYALTRPGRVSGVLNLSGFLPSNVPLTAGTVAGTRFFWGHGTQDANIPFALAAKGRTALRSANADLSEYDYDIGHWIDDDELRDAAVWLSKF